jgi:hypothetical protein
LNSTKTEEGSSVKRFNESLSFTSGAGSIDLAHDVCARVENAPFGFGHLTCAIASRTRNKPLLKHLFPVLFPVELPCLLLLLALLFQHVEVRLYPVIVKHGIILCVELIHNGMYEKYLTKTSFKMRIV